MSRHALVLNGEIIDRRDFTPLGDQAALPAQKPRWLPIETVDPAFDAVTQIRTGPVATIEPGRVVETFSVRAKNEAEVETMIAAKDGAIEREFERRHSLPIAFAVGGVSHDWHADAKAVENIMGLGILAVGAIAQNPRNWTPVGHDLPVANVDVLLLGATIAGRRDALFTIKKAKQAEVASLTDPAEVAAFNVEAGW